MSFIITSIIYSIYLIVLCLHEIGEINIPLAIATAIFIFNFIVGLYALSEYSDLKNKKDTAQNTINSHKSIFHFKNVSFSCLKWLGIIALIFMLSANIYIFYYRNIIYLLWFSMGCIISIALYHNKYFSISDLPIIETLGGFLPMFLCFAAHYILTGIINFTVLIDLIPTFFSCSTFIILSFTCDIEKDSQNGRRNLCVLLGRKRARLYCSIIASLTILSTLITIYFNYLPGLPIAVATLLIFIKDIILVFTRKLMPEDRMNIIPIGSRFVIANTLALIVSILYC